MQETGPRPRQHLSHTLGTKLMKIRKLAVLSTALVIACTVHAGKPLPEGNKTPVGSPMSVSVTPSLDAEGLIRWRHEFTFPDASFVKAHIRNLNLRPGDTLILRSDSGRVVERLTGRGPKDRGTFWSLSAFGPTLHMSLEVTSGHDYETSPFTIDKVITGYPGMFGSGVSNSNLRTPGDNQPASVCTPADFEDVICYNGDAGKWANVQASVGLMDAGGTGPTLWCSGSNVSPTNAVLTNQHCIEDQSTCDNVEFVFKYYRTGCNDGSPPTVDWVGYRCDEVLESSPFVSCDQGLNDLDYALNSVIGDPASQFGYVQPDPNPLTSGEDIYIVQHPSGRPHEITHGGGADVEVDGTVLRYYNTLDTEGGSSGSPIFRDSDDKLIGLHHCGGCSTPGTGNRGMLMSDIYPEISQHLCSTDVNLQSGGVSGWTEVTGNGDAVMDPTEAWEFTPSVLNAACSEDALDVSGTAQPDGASTGTISIANGAVDFGDIPATQSVPAMSPVEIQIDPGATCGAEFAVDITNLMGTSSGPFDLTGVAGGQLGMADLDIRFSEDFASGLGAWTIIDGGAGSGPASTWTDQDPGGRNLLDPPFVIVDSDEFGSGSGVMDEELISPVIDASGASELFLEFDHNFRWYDQGGDEQADVDVRSSATGGSWVNVANYSGGSASGFVSLDITAHAAADLQVRFHYYQADFDWWWAVDNVTVVINNGFICNAGEEIFIDGFEAVPAS